MSDKSSIELNVTRAAQSQLIDLAEEQGVSPIVRLFMAGGGCSGFTIKMDFTSHPPDEEHDIIKDIGWIKFIIDDKSALFINGATLDFGGTILDRGFKWTFPNATGGCGCGVSFSF